MRKTFPRYVMSAIKIGTHNGAFHCDEVLACTMLKLLPQYREADIVRSRDPDVLSTCDIVVDVGGVFDPVKHRYDHHQRGFDHSVSTLIPGKKWTTKLSSAGLVFVHFGKDILASILDSKDDIFVDKIFDKEWFQVYSNFMEEVDAQDNGIPMHDGNPRYRMTTHLSNRVGFLRPNWNDPKQDFDAGFRSAMDLVRLEFLDRVKYFANVWWPARTVVNSAMEERFSVSKDGQIIELSNGGCPWKEHLHELEEEQDLVGSILFAIYPDINSGWRVMAVNFKDKPFEPRLRLCPDWCGLRDDELTRVSGIPGSIFVHSAGFIGGNKTREGALEMAVRTIQLTKK